MANNKEIRDKQICSMYKQNKLVGEIAKELSIDRHTVTRVLKNMKSMMKEKLKTDLIRIKLIETKKL